MNNHSVTTELANVAACPMFSADVKKAAALAKETLDEVRELLGLPADCKPSDIAAAVADLITPKAP